MKSCIACAEQIQEAAKLCRHCNTVQTDSRFASESMDPRLPSSISAFPEPTLEDKRPTNGFLKFFGDPQSWNVADPSPEPSFTSSVFCTDCGVRNSDLDSKCGVCGSQLQKPSITKPVKQSGTASNQFQQGGRSTFDSGIERFTERLGSDQLFAAAWIFTIMTIFDSLFWLTWRDPFGTNSGLLFSQFIEWALPTAASVILFINANKPSRNLLISALVVGGALPLFFDLVLNQGIASTLFAVLGIWTFGDFVDFAASVGLIVFTSLRLKRA